MQALTTSGSHLARRTLRLAARRLRAAPDQTGAHFERLQAALLIPGVEPAQGCLADLFAALGPTQAPTKQAALALVAARLPVHVRRWFDAAVSAPALPRVTPLATRWSVYAIPSADISTRARRVSPDDSRALAQAVVAPVLGGDATAQAAFFHHCLTCHDKLAFMLARRALLQSMPTLPEGWDAVSQQLEQAVS